MQQIAVDVTTELQRKGVDYNMTADDFSGQAAT